MYRLTEQGALKEKLFYALEGTTTVISGGRLIDGRGGPPLDNATVVVEGERIAAVGPADQVQVPDHPGVRHVDAQGRTILPGLIDLHVHFTGDMYRDYRRYMQPAEDVRILRGAIDAHAIFSAGFTTVRVLGHGTPNQAESLKRTFNKRLLAGPRIYHAGWAFSQTGGHGNLPIWPYEVVEMLRPRSAFADGVNGCRVAVRRNLGQGADWIKFYATEGVITTPPHKQGLPNYTIEEIEAMCDEAHRRGARVSAHATAAGGIINAVKGGVDTIEHGAPDSGDEWLGLMAERGTVLIPTLTVYASAAENKGGHLSQAVVEVMKQRIEDQLKTVARAKELGVIIGMGTDDGRSPLAGQNAWEMELLVEAGLTPMEAIIAATKTAGETLGLGEHLGTVEKGKVADLIVVDGDPSEDIHCLRRAGNPQFIIKSGATL